MIRIFHSLKSKYISKRNLFTVSFAVLLSLAVSLTVSANPGYFGGEGEHIVSTGKKSLILDKERVIITIAPPFARVEGVYHICNPEKESTVEIGFPHLGPQKTNEMLGSRKPQSFAVSVNDVPVKHTPVRVKKEKNVWMLTDDKGNAIRELSLPPRKTAPPGSSDNFWESIYSAYWYLWKVHFDAGEEKKIVCSYEHLLGGLDHFWSFFYKMKTGSTWSQSIKSVDIEVDLSENTSLDYHTPPFREKLASLYTRGRNDRESMMLDCTFNFLTQVSPPGFTLRGNTLVWHFENYKPVDDISLVWNHPPLSATSVLENSFRYAADKAVDGDPSTCWAEGVKDSGIGQRLRIPVKSRFSLMKTGPVSGVSLLAGYAKNEETFQNNNRPRKIRLDFCRLSTRGVTMGSCILRKTLELKDTAKWQHMELNRFFCADGLALQIDSVYRGTKFDDTAISELKPELMDVRVTASSCGGRQYLPENVFDAVSAFNSAGNLNTAWVEGAKGPGRGEWVKIDWGKRKEVSLVSIYPGYGKSEGIGRDRLFFENNQLGTAILEFSDGSRKKIDFPRRSGEYYSGAAFTFAPVMTSSLKLIIREVYPGKKYDDTCISDIEINPPKAGAYKTVDECW